MSKGVEVVIRIVSIMGLTMMWGGLLLFLWAIGPVSVVAGVSLAVMMVGLYACGLATAADGIRQRP